MYLYLSCMWIDWIFFSRCILYIIEKEIDGHWGGRQLWSHDSFEWRMEWLRPVESCWTFMFCWPLKLAFPFCQLSFSWSEYVWGFKPNVYSVNTNPHHIWVTFKRCNLKYVVINMKLVFKCWRVNMALLLHLLLFSPSTF